jgi:hypothetical protein
VTRSSGAPRWRHPHPRSSTISRLADNFATEPERARKGPAGSSADAMRLIAERCAERERAVHALIAALRG